MIWKAVWHTSTTELLARIALAVVVSILGSWVLHFSPTLSAGLAVILFLLIYRVRFKHF
jgi:hypothetical protein